MRAHVLITGSSRGIGLELVRQYAADDYDVTATCRDPEHADELRAVRGAVAIKRLDVTSEHDFDVLVAEIGDRPIDVLICNAAVFGGNRSRFADVDWAAWRTALEVNLLGSMRVALGLWKNVARSDEKKIVFVSSRAGLPREARPATSYIYASSKAALNSRGASARPRPRTRGSDGRDTSIPATCAPGSVAPTRRCRRPRACPGCETASGTSTPADAGKFLHFDGSELKL